MPLRLPVSISREASHKIQRLARVANLSTHSRPRKQSRRVLFTASPISTQSTSRPALIDFTRDMSSNTSNPTPSSNATATATAANSTTTSADSSITTTTTTTPNPTAGPLEKSIYTKIMTTLKPTKLRITNDSHKHAHHAAMATLSTPVPERETHFRLEIVSDAFDGQRQPARHRVVYGLCAEEMALEGGVHALQISARTRDEEERRRVNADAA